MRPIDADALTEILTTAIRNMEGLAKFIGCEDDPEIKMEIKAYRDILNGVKEQPTIEPERKKGKWIDEGFYADGHGAHAFRCSECGGHIIEYDVDPFCRWCGADMREEQDG